MIAVDATLELDIEQPGMVARSVTPSLTDSERVAFESEHDESCLTVHVTADSLGTLRGGVNTALRCVKTGNRVIGEYR